MGSKRDIPFVPPGSTCFLELLRRTVDRLVVVCEGHLKTRAVAEFTGVRAVRVAEWRQMVALEELPLGSPLLENVALYLHEAPGVPAGQPCRLYRFVDGDECPCIEVLATGCSVSQHSPDEGRTWPQAVHLR